MKKHIIHIVSGAVFLASVAAFSQGTAGDTLGQLFGSSEKELSKSIQELNRLRDQVAAEKIPLTQDLTASEEKLAQSRKEYEQVRRTVDLGGLELATMKNEIKSRQDEQVYIGNLLDEYARSFESKVTVCELQYCGKVLEDAKAAAENKTLSATEKAAKQTAFVQSSVERLLNAIGGMRFAGSAVDMQGAVENGQFAVIGPVALFCSEDGRSSGLAIPQTGSSRPLVRPLAPALQSGIAELVKTGEGLMPLDPSRGGALKALVQKVSVVRIFKKGGPIMWPLLCAALIAMITVIERVLFLLGQKAKRDTKAMDRFFDAVEQGDMEGAAGIGQDSKFYVVRTLGYALKHKEKSLANALVYAQEQEMKRFRRGIPILDTIITLAPLLGLLGTVTGMMGSFSLIGGELSSPGAITGGIAEALIATAFGLGIAITSLIPFNFLNTKMEEARIEIETAAKQLELLVHPASAMAGDAKAARGAQRKPEK